jgi:hypothetical protein
VGVTRAYHPDLRSSTPLGTKPDPVQKSGVTYQMREAMGMGNSTSGSVRALTNKKVLLLFNNNKWHILWQGKVTEEGLVSKMFRKEYFNSACISQNHSELHEFDAIKT